MIAAIFRSSIILLAAAVFAALLRRQSAAVRHAVLTTGLLAALLTPLISRVLPSWDSELVNTISRAFAPIIFATDSRAESTALRARWPAE